MDIEEQIELAYWRFDDKRKGRGEYLLNTQDERGAFKQEMRKIVKAAVEAERKWMESECKRISEESDTLAASCSDDELDSVIATGVAAHELMMAISARGEK